ncbi:regulatory protein (GGDEF and EAL domains) [Legionella quinlivanii]|uniref:Regulatory protein (GGDEF and EAL domains) n=1 Tax=Legionella quinlivanii TaxID=45073 RepID=A0A0W0XLP6_9GAMM|nr:EAL domain-containing protein [Legionella quinlivanii]KTD45467.1 regulatory protein (GGDEF and EAL domains) [Legionella quinlivanii]MCW8451245.1 EAL domain-containing protein [Legionella quinlivanii]SEG32993.1 diguanylate cyclase (GGDEF) domain-containing protein [Legionella quinlivanii DSM 21216]STY10558.1 regulatory protein (GGDEF and EAL domains) [Legionella quinlivanii]
MDNNNYDFRIIVIDDNVEIHKDFLKILTKNAKNDLDDLGAQLFDMENLNANELILPRFKIDTATQGQDGAALIEKALNEGKPFALAFVDIRMPPGWDGIETIKNIWTIDPDIHVVICTAFSDYNWEETIQELGHSDKFLILKKPFDHIAVRQLAYALTRKWKLIGESKAYTQSLEQAVEERTEELKYQATHDMLTGLANRALLHDRVQQAIAAYKRHKISFAILFFDLDRFKLINDSLGHSAGDELLIRIAKRLLPTIRAFDTVSRLGGDEFVIVVTELKQIDYIHNVAQKILQIIKEPMTIANRSLSISSSMGIATYPGDGEEADELLRNADAAMYHAKKMGGGQYQFYSKEMNEKVFEQLELESDLYQAVNNNEFTVWYQPQFHIENHKLEAVEALIRWIHPQKGMLLPIDFIPLAERTGLMIPIGDWVIREACQQNKRWQAMGLPPIRMAVNLTSQQISQLDFVQKIKTILQETQLAPKYFELELSESSIINEMIIQKMNELKEIGIEIALDDFGTGYANLHHLRNLSLNRLKIDRSFINNIQLNRNDEVIIHAIIAMARSLDLEVLAEGVETQKQLEFLKKHHCNQIQGFYFSKPLPADEMTNLLEHPEAIEKILNQENNIKE